MGLFFIILIVISALLIIGGVVVLSFGRGGRPRRSESAHRYERVASESEKETPVRSHNTISFNLAEDEDKFIAKDEAPMVYERRSARSKNVEPMHVEPMRVEAAPLAPKHVERVEAAKAEPMRVEPVRVEPTPTRAMSEEEIAAKQQQALLFLQGAEALYTLDYALKKLESVRDDDKRDDLMVEIKDCAAAIDSEAVRNACKATFDAMYPDFSKKLLKISPDLNDTELRLCIFMALGQSTKDVAVLTRRSIRTIETSIYHLRKKLGIPAEEKTPDFLKKLL